jgi:uncharacterized protein YijF (DUF1287 family)
MITPLGFHRKEPQPKTSDSSTGGKKQVVHLRLFSYPVVAITISPMRRASSVAPWLLVATFGAFCAAQAAAPISREEFTRRLVAAATERTHHTVRYVSEYVRIPYPGGDVPADTGVCTDEIIRSYRAVGVDLQKEVHEDMLRNFAAYPNQRRHRNHPDPNIDHRRVLNLMVFFQRKGESLPITHRAEDYVPGDLVAWDLGGNVPHIGIVVDQKSRWSGRCLVVHNIGEGPKMEDVLFSWKITGHYRYFGPGL